MLLNDFDVVSITETWLLDGIYDQELFDSRYLVWRRDRDYASTNQIYGGGVLLAVRRDLAAVERTEWRSSAEDIWVTVSMKNNRTATQTHLCTLYLCDQNEGYTYTSQLQNFTDKLFEIVSTHPGDNFIIMGDFNMPYLTWNISDDNILEPSGISGSTQEYFFDTINSCNLVQFNHAHNVNNRILDLIFSNNCLDTQICSEPLVPEDLQHKSLEILFTFSDSSSLKTNHRMKYFYNNGDYDAICSALDDMNWHTILRDGSVDDAAAVLYNYIYNLRDKHVPHKKIAPSTFPPWYSFNLKKLLKEKYKFWSKYKTYGNRGDYLTFCLLRKRAKSLETECFKSYVSRTEDSISTNPKIFWSYVKSLSKTSHGLPSTMNYEGTSADKGEEVCNLFASYFQSTFLLSNNTIPLLNPNLNPNVPTIPYNSLGICDISINATEVLKLLESLDINKGAGPDDIPPLLIKTCSSSLVKPLCILFQRSVREGVVPKLWKSAFITPVHKSGDKSNVKNYRPISKLCVFSKIFERVIYNQVYAALSSSFIFEQHGFLKRRSTVSNLILFNDYITAGMENGKQIDAIFTDFSKAFDRIDHTILLQKLYFSGIHGNLYRWFTSYINNRTQAIAINGYISSWNLIPSGVPQGSLLGPLLFIIFINDVSSCFRHSEILLYADDMKIFRTVNNINDSLLLQEDLMRFEEYCLINKLDLNVSKCYSITFTRKTNVLNTHYLLRDHLLNKVNGIRDLGVFEDSKVMFDQHIENIVKRASKSLGFIIRSCRNFSKIKSIKIIYCSYVRSILEYASELWNPCYDKYIYRIESIQKRFMRYLQYKSGCLDTNYEARCKRYHFLPLEMRRTIADVVFLYKISNSYIDSPPLLQNINISVPPRSLRTRPLLTTPFARTNYRRNSFFCRVPHKLNVLVNVHSDIDLFNTKLASLRRVLSAGFFGSQN